ncbi:MAG TPA: GAF domain-containing protein [Anaerolineales bacterium]|nr:GAF domain-containing protein [Anaerolineales bacterium]
MRPPELLRNIFEDHPLVASPLRSNGTPYGLLMVASKAGEETDALRPIQSLADRLSMSLEVDFLHARLRAMQANYQSLFEEGQAGLLLADGDGRLVDVNRSAANIFGYALREMAGMSLERLFPGGLIPGAAQRGVECAARCKNGMPLSLYASAWPMHRDGERNWLISVQDLSEVRRLEEVVQRLDRLKDEVVRHLAVGMLLLDVNGYIAYANLAAAEMFGLPLDHLLGEHWTLVVPEDQQSIIRDANVRRMFGVSDRFEMQLLRSGSHRFHALVSGRPFEENGRYAGNLSFITDISEQREAEAKLLEQNEALQRALQRLEALNQAAASALQGLDAGAIMQAVGLELARLGMNSLIALLNAEGTEWVIEHAAIENRRGTRSSVRRSLIGARTRVRPSDRWYQRLQSGETLTVRSQGVARREAGGSEMPFAEPLKRYEIRRAVLAPLRAGDRVFGALMVWGEGLSDADAPSITAFANHLSIALEKARLFGERARLAAETDLQDQLDRALAALVERALASRNVQDVVEAALRGVAELLPCQRVSLTEFNFATGGARILGTHGSEVSSLASGQVMSLEEWGVKPELIAGKLDYIPDALSAAEPAKADLSLAEAGFRAWAAIPLRERDTIIGALGIASREANAFTPRHLATAQRVADQLAVALTNARSYEQARQRADELAALHEIALDIAGENELRPLMHASIQHACTLLRAERGAIFLVDVHSAELRAVAECNIRPSILGLSLLKGRGIAGRVWEWAAPVILRGASAKGETGQLLSHYERGIALGVPLLWSGEVRGAMVVLDSSSARDFSHDDASLLERLAAQVALGLENVRKHEALRRRMEQLRVVNDLGRRISAILELDELQAEALRSIATSFAIDRVTLFSLESGELVEAAAYPPQDGLGAEGAPRRLQAAPTSVVGLAATEGVPILSPDPASKAGESAPGPLHPRSRSCAAVPLRRKGVVTGVLVAESEHLAAFDRVDAAALQALAAHLSTAIENASLYAETRQAQAQLAEAEKLRALGLMTSGIAHDFNNMLAVILARAELALMRVQDPRVRKDLEQVIASAKDGGETIHRLQDFARTRKNTSDFIGVDLNQIVTEALEFCRPRWKDLAQRSGVDIEVVTELAATRNVTGSPVELREVLVNLIFNAVEAMPKGGRLRVNVETFEDGARLMVTDSGAGMTEDVKNQLFVPFFTTKEHGTGLGLSMVYGVVQRHGGQIEVESAEGAGTSITIWLPHSPESKVLGRRATDLSAPESIRPASVLVVEDERTIRDGLAEILELVGHKVITACNGEEGLQRFDEIEHLDVVLTDLGMPRQGGWDLIEQLRQRDPALPVIILSGWGDEIDQERAREHGVAKVIAKPFSVTEVLGALAEVVEALDAPKEVE